MDEPQLRRMEEISIPFAEFLREFFVAAFAINIVAGDRMANRTQMNPDLVGTSGFDRHFEQRKTAELFHHPILGMRPTSFARSHFGPRCRMTADRQFDCPAVASRFA